MMELENFLLQLSGEVDRRCNLVIARFNYIIFEIVI